jgi:hypothetical protein
MQPAAAVLHKTRVGLRAVGIREVIFFHSEATYIQDYHDPLPFNVVADPRRVFYRQYKVERSPFALINLFAWVNLIRGYRLKEAGKQDSTPFGLPAEFLIDDAGVIVRSHYGTHSSVQWTVDDVLAIAAKSNKPLRRAGEPLQECRRMTGTLDSFSASTTALKDRNKPDRAECEWCAMSDLQYQNVGDSEIAYRVYGAGEPLLLIHGYPLHGATFRKLIPLLASSLKCFVVDLPGAGESRWTEKTDFGFSAQAQVLKVFVEKLGLRSYSLLSHDTGGTIARQLSIIDSQRVRRQVIIGTEIPNHRPPWIQFFQLTSRLPGSNNRFKETMSSAKFLHSSLGFGGCFYNDSLIDGEFHQLFVRPMVDCARVREGQIRRLRGIDWKLVDSLA